MHAPPSPRSEHGSDGVGVVQLATPRDSRSPGRSRVIHQVLVSPAVGGAAVIAIRLAAAAPRYGWHARAWVPGSGAASAALDGEQVPWRRYDLSALWRSAPRQLLACMHMVPGLAGRERPIVHVQNPGVYRLLRPALLAVRAKSVVHFHIEPSAEEIQWSLSAPPDHVAVCATYIAHRIRGVLGDARCSFPITVVPNGIDVERFTRSRAARLRHSPARTARPLVILMLANLARHKGQATAIRALQVLRNRGVQAECWLAGEDRTPGREYERELRALASELGLADHVKFLGFRADAPELLAAADVFVLPSTHEGLPLALLEAQAAGVPVLGAPIPGILEVIEEGKTGFVASADDYAAYADRIQQLLDNPRLRGDITDAAARGVSENHTFDALEKRVFSIYASLHINAHTRMGEAA